MQYEFISIRHAEEAHKTKFSLLRVCKTWYPLVKELLFEHLSASRESILLTVLTTLRQTPLSYRSRTRRLDIGRRFHSISDKATHMLMDILPLAPNLEILRIEGYFDTLLESDLRLSLARHSPNLKLLRYQGECLIGLWYSPATHHYLALPQLQSFSGGWMSSRQNARMPVVVESANLTSLSLTFSYESEANFFSQGLNLPALRHFAVTGIYGGQDGFLQFLDIHGNQLTTLMLGFKPGILLRSSSSVAITRRKC